MQLLGKVEMGFRVAVSRGRATDPDWTERRLVPLAPGTLKRLEAIAEDVGARSGVSVELMQLVALLLETTTEQLNKADVKDLVTVLRPPQRPARIDRACRNTFRGSHCALIRCRRG